MYFTKGEWKLNGLPNPMRPEYYCLYTKEGGPETINHLVTITASGLIEKHEMTGNAKLIAAAPELLKTCEEMLKCILETDWDVAGISDEEVNKWKTVIAKATSTKI